MFENLFSKDFWRKKRAENLYMARKTKAITGGPGVDVWVRRARRCHNIVMGREEICSHITVINNQLTNGDIYAD